MKEEENMENISIQRLKSEHILFLELSYTPFSSKHSNKENPMLSPKFALLAESLIFYF